MSNNNINNKIDVLKTSAHPVRISILEKLLDGVKCVSDIKEFLDISQPILSQHLAALRRSGIIDFFIDGRLRCYFLKDPLIIDLLDILARDYPEKLPGPECCPATKKGHYPGDRNR